jgi:hypothetical protein
LADQIDPIGDRASSGFIPRSADEPSGFQRDQTAPDRAFGTMGNPGKLLVGQSRGTALAAFAANDPVEVIGARFQLIEGRVAQAVPTHRLCAHAHAIARGGDQAQQCGGHGRLNLLSDPPPRSLVTVYVGDLI